MSFFEVGGKDMKRHFLIAVALFTLSALVVGALTRFVTHGPHSALEGARASLDRGALKQEYAKLIQADFFNLENHRGYLDAHLSQPKVTHTKHSTYYRDDTGIEKLYNGYVSSADPKVRDIGLYGLGYFYAREKESDKALSYLQKIVDRKMAYLNNTIGFIYLMNKHRPDIARDYFYKEIEVKGNLDGAVFNLAKMFLDARDYRKLHDLSENKELGPHLPLSYLRELDLAEWNIGGYLSTLFKSEENTVSLESLLASLVIAAMFLIYIYFIDIFEKERISLLLSLFVMGLGSAVLCTVFYDMADHYLGLHSTGDDLNDLFYFIFGVGLIEETVKALPVLITVFLWKKGDEPVDILIYASVSALGFACLENAGYFNRVAIGLIIGRTLSAVVMHICLTTLAVYGIFYHRNRKDPMGILYVFGCFALAVVLHGLYDFFLSSSLGMGMLSTLILIVMMLMFRNMLQNALGQSPFMRSGNANIDLYLYLFYGVLCILSMQFVILDVQYGFDLSMKNLGRNLLNYFFLTFVLVSDFGHIEVVKNKWTSLLYNPRKKAK